VDRVQTVNGAQDTNGRVTLQRGVGAGPGWVKFRKVEVRPL
jgi:hypothetical protein